MTGSVELFTMEKDGLNRLQETTIPKEISSLPYERVVILLHDNDDIRFFFMPLFHIPNLSRKILRLEQKGMYQETPHLFSYGDVEYRLKHHESIYRPNCTICKAVNPILFSIRAVYSHNLVRCQSYICENCIDVFHTVSDDLLDEPENLLESVFSC